MRRSLNLRKKGKIYLLTLFQIILTLEREILEQMPLHPKYWFFLYDFDMLNHEIIYNPYKSIVKIIRVNFAL